MEFVEVAVDAPISENKTFSYSVPLNMSLKVGQLVLVPFGRRILQGVVVETVVVPSVQNTRDVLEIVFDAPLIDDFRMKLALWMSDYYICSIFDAATLMFPVGSHNRSEIIIRLKDHSEPFVGSEFQAKIHSFVRDREKVSMERIVSRFGGRARTSVAILEKEGKFLREIKTPKPTVRPKYMFVPVITESGVKALRGSGLSGSPKQKATLEYLANDFVALNMPELRKLFGSQPIRTLLEKGFLLQVREKVSRDPDLGVDYSNLTDFRFLTSEQKNAAAIANQIIRDTQGSPRAMLLYGVTGSGKTEVYLNAVETCFSEGKRAIVLVPEIALTPQTIDRFSSRFPGDIAVLHSGLSSGERYDQWWKIKNGQYRLVIGSRSAIFAPQPDLGLVVIDEEHEWAYKQNEGSPKYHARDVSMHLAGITKAAVILGSASPDIESYQRAIRGRYKIAKLQKRFKEMVTLSENNVALSSPLSTDMASVQVVDMREELKQGNSDIFSRELLANLKQTISDGNQAILFLNRRGSHGFVQCRGCGTMQRCRSCDVGLTYHSDTNSLICHYCAVSRRFLSKCGECQGENISKYGVGTQLVAERFKELFPEVSAVRWDRDSAKSFREYREILDNFQQQQTQVLIGTQVIAKGHHLPGVTLVGIVSADVGLGLPDFRAGERAFQVICQVSGRAGRGKIPGKVILQTYQPDHYSVATAADQNYPSFFEIESRYRKRFLHPPYSRLIRLLRQEPNDVNCEREARALVLLLKEQRRSRGMTDVDILGPTPAFPSRVRGHYRWQILLRGSNPRVLLDTVRFRRNGGRTSKMKDGWIIDVSPSFQG
jgi:primosomal protein N' (replication factor Y)